MKYTQQIQALRVAFRNANGGLHPKYGWMHPSDFHILVRELHAWTPRGLPLRYVTVDGVNIYPIAECPVGTVYLTREILGGRCE